MSRLYDYDGGSIRIGGLDIKEISTKSLFEKIAIVFQDVTLFNASVLEKISIGKKTPQMRSRSGSTIGQLRRIYPEASGWV